MSLDNSFEILFNSTEDYILIINESGKIMRGNEQILRRLGFSHEDIKDNDVLMLFPPEKRGDAVELMEQIKNESINAFNMPLCTRQAEPVAVVSRVIKGDWGGEPAYYFLIKEIAKIGKVSDIIKISELEQENLGQKQKEQQRQNEYKEMLLATIPSAVFSVDANKNINVWNKMAEEITGYTEAEVIGKPCTLFALDPCMTQCGLFAVDITKPVTNKVCTIKNKDGEVRQISKNVDALRDENGSIIGGIECFEDITDRVRIEKKLKESEERYAAIVNSAPEIIIIHKKGRIVFINNTGVEASGYSKNEIIGNNIGYFLPEKSLEVFNRAIHGRMKGEQGFDYANYDLDFVTKSGQILNLIVKPTAITYENEPADLAVLIDVTELKQAEINLKKSEEKFRQLAESIEEVFWLKEGRELLYISPAYEKIWGLDRESIYKNPDILGSSIYAEDRERFELAMMNEQYVSRGYLDGEFRIVRPDGSIRWLRLRTFPVKDAGGSIIREAGIAEDVTERRLAQNELEIAKKAAETANVMKSQFLANMSHEIKTPIGGIIGFLDLLKQTELAAAQKEYIHEAQAATEELLYLINDILDFSKIEAGNISMEYIAFMLRPVVEDAVAVIVPKAWEKRLEVHTFINSNVPDQVIGDPSRLKQVLNTLLDNAVKFTHNGEILVSVNMKAEEEGIAELSFEVKDTGVGIEEENLENIFRPFIQADASTTREYGGTGLGLAISAELVELMQGDIHVESIPAEGSAFSFTAKFKIGKGKSRSNIAWEELDKLNVMIVDDNATNRKIIKAYLESAHCNVYEAENGALALAVLLKGDFARNPVDIVLVDYQMPVMDGLEFATALQMIPSLKTIKLILLTSAGQKGDAHKAEKKGFLGYITKPIKKDELLECLSLVWSEPDLTGGNGIITKHTAQEMRRFMAPRILLADGYDVNRKLFINVLKSSGLSCDIAMDGLEAFRAVVNKVYDMVFMNCQMPGMDGCEATRRIRASEGNNKHTPIIAVIHSDLPADREKCLQAGMDDCIISPIQVEALLETVNRYTGWSSV